MAEAAHAALLEAGLERPDAIVVATMNPEEFLGDGNFASNVATHMGFAEIPTSGSRPRRRRARPPSTSGSPRWRPACAAPCSSSAARR